MTGRTLSGLAAGTLFGLGLAVSQMMNPAKVLSFLNLAGAWDPSLALVMAAATAVAFIGFRWAAQGAPLFAEKYYLPTRRDIDARLITGAAIFGTGWGLAGYCPGPALTALASGALEPALFVLSMLAGSQVARWLLPN